MVTKAIIVSVVYAVCVSTAHTKEKDKDPFVSLRGKNYEVAHKVLLKSGYKPVDLRKVPGHACMPGSEAICQMYPEVDACAVDDDSPCRFDWETSNGRRLVVFTVGEHIHNLIVADVDWE